MSVERKYTEIEVKAGLNKINNPHLPYSWDLNIFRGCCHDCKYCFAQYSHNYLNDDDFFDCIYIKKNIVEVVEKELSTKKIQGDIINIGGVTDSYQAKEAELKIMPQLIKLFIKHKTPITISTKSDIILRDYDLIDELSRLTYVNIACTITAFDASIQQKIEPNAVSSEKRFAVLREFIKTNANTGVHMMPIVPYITDDKDNIQNIYRCAKDTNVNYVLPGILNLKGTTKPYFLNFIKYTFPDKYDKLVNLYKSAYAPKEYQRALYDMIGKISKEYNLYNSFNTTIRKNIAQNPKHQQMSIWDD